MTALLSVDLTASSQAFLPVVTKVMRGYNHNTSSLFLAFILSRRNLNKLPHVPAFSFHQSVGQVCNRKLVIDNKAQVPLWEGLTEQQHQLCEESRLTQQAFSAFHWHAQMHLCEMGEILAWPFSCGLSVHSSVWSVCWAGGQGAGVSSSQGFFATISAYFWPHLLK